MLLRWRRAPALLSSTPTTHEGDWVTCLASSKKRLTVSRHATVSEHSHWQRCSCLLVCRKSYYIRQLVLALTSIDQSDSTTSSTTLAKNCETATQAKHRRVHARQITRLCHVSAVVPIFFGQGSTTLAKKKRTVIEIRGEKNAVPRVISCFASCMFSEVVLILVISSNQGSKSFLCQSQSFSGRAQAPIFWLHFLSTWSQSCANTTSISLGAKKKPSLRPASAHTRTRTSSMKW